MDSDPRLVVFFIILSTNPKMLQMMNILVSTQKVWEGGGRILVFFYRNIKTIIQNIETPKGQINWKVL